MFVKVTHDQLATIHALAEDIPSLAPLHARLGRMSLRPFVTDHSEVAIPLTTHEAAQVWEVLVRTDAPKAFANKFTGLGLLGHGFTGAVHDKIGKLVADAALVRISRFYEVMALADPFRHVIAAHRNFVDGDPEIETEYQAERLHGWEVSAIKAALRKDIGGGTPAIQMLGDFLLVLTSGPNEFFVGQEI